jgi:exonuclease III
MERHNSGPKTKQLKSRLVYPATSELLHTFDQIDMVDIYRVFHPTTRQYTFFSTAHETFSRIDHILGHKESLNKSRKLN